MSQYPYFLEERQIGPGAVNEFGQPIQGAETWVPIGKCRDEIKNGNNQIIVGGDVTIFSAFVLVPKSCPKLKPGTAIRVKDEDGQVRISGDVKQFRVGSLHGRIWL